MKVGALDFAVAILAGVSCLFMLINVPVWALFVGWTWYFVLGCTPDTIKKCIPPLITGALLAVLAFILIDILSKTGIDSTFSLTSTIIAVVITVFLLMLSLEIPQLNNSLVSFNAYSCFFVGYAAGTFLPIQGMPTLLNAIIWIAGANFIGVLFGWMSIKLSSLSKKTTE